MPLTLPSPPPLCTIVPLRCFSHAFRTTATFQFLHRRHHSLVLQPFATCQIAIFSPVDSPC
ncbi:uncharacterized protein EI90DRAFT_3042883 [Cantharellus anzutake]|uniref:uncharacterized protein n=1 Tax=Cantharellus anzutake TaxID=1750568 RepID=UPI0019048DBA|nr:uncharacterized protein EI90DRAFT_3042883 [Cantharellus anzutake]KAF8337408.1 hypothetical protein EI90DRAFT_3042883 [Cantharellus anzutake]